VGWRRVIIISLGLEGEQLEAFAERLRALMERCRIVRPDVDIRVAASIGCTVARHGEPWTKVTSRADDLMHENKRRGRNRVTHG
jgi:two-component system, cell cycle response regulator